MTNHSKLIVAGCRSFTNYPLLAECLNNFYYQNFSRTIEIVCGEARGADKLGRRWFEENQSSLKKLINIKSFPVMPEQWQSHGKQAGYFRNRQMAEYATHLIAFWDGNVNQSGTYLMIGIAESLSLDIEVVRFTPPRKPEMQELPPIFC